MNILEAVRTSITEILSHKLRSMLTLVGIVLGTTSLVVMVSVIGAVGIAVQKGLADLGFDGVLFVVSQPSTDNLEKKRPYSRGLRASDLSTLESGAELIDGIAPVLSSEDETAQLNGRRLKVKVEGITGAFSAVRNRTAEAGRFILPQDVDDVASVAVIGRELKDQAFGTDDAVGREIVVRGLRLKVVGVMRALGSNQVQDDEMKRDNSKVYIPISTMKKHLTGADQVSYYAFKVKDPSRLTEGEKEAKALLRRSHRGISDFRVMNIGEEILRIRREVDKLISNWTVVLASIAGISLLVGGIGIFSVMQISISERLYEIGLRKAIGATDGAVFGQFLIESVSLSLVGGLCGAALGFGITLIAGQAFEDGLSVSPLGLLLAAAFAILIGLSAGVYPALRASRLAPVEAIRGA